MLSEALRSRVKTLMHGIPEDGPIVDLRDGIEIDLSRSDAIIDDARLVSPPRRNRRTHPPGRRGIGLKPPTANPVFDRLDEQELGIAHLIAAGFTNNQIAATYDITTEEATSVVHHVLDRLGFQSRAELLDNWYRGRTRVSR